MLDSFQRDDPMSESAVDLAKAPAANSKTNYSIVVGNRLLIGGFINGTNKDVAKITPYVKGNEKYTLSKDLKVVEKNVKGSKDVPM
jgi:hypothetical protein